MRLQRQKLKAVGTIPETYELFADDGPLPDYSNLENPEEVEQRRWDVVNRIRLAHRQ